MKRYIRLLLCLFVMMVAAFANAQTMKYQDIYRVKKKDTIYGIAKKYNITIDELRRTTSSLFQNRLLWWCLSRLKPKSPRPRLPLASREARCA